MTRALIFVSCIFATLFSNAEIVSDGDTMVEQIKDTVDLNTEKLIRMLDHDPDVFLIDVRTESEVKELGSIGRGQNINIPSGRLVFEVNDVTSSDENAAIIVYSNENKRSILAANQLDKMGYNNVKNYADGYNKWVDYGNPISLSDMAPDSILYRTPTKIYKEVVIPSSVTDEGVKIPKRTVKVEV
ncbi:MAG TPA: rhodanese-like domain-containing protein, partial [Gammaproteobacteria bacterium]|nr:rhodanese-like domain-containing protein [Gammaproteobacteria bacterium]